MKHEFQQPESLSNARAALVGKCAVCGGECCNCKVCVIAKRGRFNVCAKCSKAFLASVEAGGAA